ncbi:F-box protein CPR1-like [Lotus japonicus]|uniref:F-box protein CPR1-like n=1 Tax=Lotus japonicus TaxID=34305 RepID=UPI00258A16DF|nr:F-box protein CPR1-like [Lotus japonicus]
MALLESLLVLFVSVSLKMVKVLDSCQNTTMLSIFHSTKLVSRKSLFMEVDDDEIAMCHGFGIDCVSDKYKVVLVIPDPSSDNLHITVTKVYAFGDDSWTTIQGSSFLGDTTNGLGKFVGNTLNLGGNPEGPIEAVLKDCLCVCYDHEETHLVVWLMKEYGVKESWVKLMAIPHVELQVFGFVPHIEPLCMSEDGVVLVYTTFFE